MGRPRQFFDFNVPSTTQGHLRSLVKIIFRRKKEKKGPKRNTGKKKRQITEVKRALQSTFQKWKSWVEHSPKTKTNKKTKKRREKQQQKAP